MEEKTKLEKEKKILFKEKKGLNHVGFSFSNTTSIQAMVKGIGHLKKMISLGILWTTELLDSVVHIVVLPTFRPVHSPTYPVYSIHPCMGKKDIFCSFFGTYSKIDQFF